MQEIFFEETTKSATNTGRGALLRQDGRTYTIGSSASLRWVAKSVNSNAHPRILLPQNRCNTLDFASKVVCQRGAAAPLETQEKRPSTTLLVLGQCADPLAHSLDQRNDKRIPHGEIAQSFRHPGCPIIREAVEPFAFDGR